MANKLEALRIAGAAAVLETGPDPVVELRVCRDILAGSSWLIFSPVRTLHRVDDDPQ